MSGNVPCARYSRRIQLILLQRGLSNLQQTQCRGQQYLSSVVSYPDGQLVLIPQDIESAFLDKRQLQDQDISVVPEQLRTAPDYNF